MSRSDRTNRSARRTIGRLACYTWAGPTTLVGLVAVGLSLAWKGRVQVRRGAIEVHGGFSSWYLRRVARASAMTLGHVILGQDDWCLEWARDHEQAHVRQVERWGPAFLPAYVMASVWAWARGGHYYYDNYFEIDARRACGEADPRLSRRPRQL